MIGVGVGGALGLQLQQSCIKKMRNSVEKNNGLFMLMDQWVNIKQDGREIKEYFVRNNFKRIAIYGMGYVGQRLLKELKDSEIEIVYGIDKKAKNMYSEIKLVTVEEPLLNVDAIVVTTMYDVNDIYNTLASKVDCAVIAIEDIINEI